MTPKLPLEDVVETRLYRLFVEVVRNDPTLSKVVKTWKDWSDSAHDRVQITSAGQLPAVEFWPGAGREQFASPDAMKAELLIDVRVATAGLLIDNCWNLWGAVLRAVRPRDNVAAIILNRRFQEAGAETGRFLVTRPAFATPPAPKDAANNSGAFEASGTFSLAYFNK